MRVFASYQAVSAVQSENCNSANQEKKPENHCRDNGLGIRQIKKNNQHLRHRNPGTESPSVGKHISESCCTPSQANRNARWTHRSWQIAAISTFVRSAARNLDVEAFRNLNPQNHFLSNIFFKTKQSFQNSKLFWCKIYGEHSEDIYSYLIFTFSRCVTGILNLWDFQLPWPVNDVTFLAKNKKSFKTSKINLSSLCKRDQQKNQLQVQNFSGVQLGRTNWQKCKKNHRDKFKVQSTRRNMINLVHYLVWTNI